MAEDDIDVEKSAARLKAIPSGKIVDFISGKLLNDTPEEYVRQNIAMSLVLEYGYDRSQIEIEFKVKLASSSKRADIAIFDKNHDHAQENVRVIVEAKKPETKTSDKKDGVEQLKSYMAACINCGFGLWTNGDDRACLAKVEVDDQHQFIDALDIPLSGDPSPTTPSRQHLRSATGDNLLFTFRRCHNYIAGNQGLQKPEAFWELLKVIFCKIEDERSGEGTLEFFVSHDERFSMNGRTKAKARIQKIFWNVLKKYPSIFSASEKIDMNPAALAYVVSQLQQYSLLNTSVDVKGIAYEEVVGSNLRGDRGEFFTPRNACHMAVAMLNPQPNEVILDPACGTGGFLVTAMQRVLEIIDQRHKIIWRDHKNPTSEELSELYRERNNFLQNHLFGLDLNPNLVRAAKMNMVMNNDGSGSLYQTNSLEHPHRWDSDVLKRIPLGSIDVLFTNPPFGTKIRIDDPRILQQFDVAAQWDLEEGRDPEIRLSTDGAKLFQGAAAPEILFVERCIQWLRPGGRMAIVLPNGLLNNPGLMLFRHSILSKVQLLAVVDMYRDLFQPQNDTQTSMVLFRKWDTAERSMSFGDYHIFMAIADKIGHDKRGAHIYKRHPDGSLVLEEKRTIQEKHTETGKEAVEVNVRTPIIDDELPAVADAYHSWLKEQLQKVPFVSGGAA